ncbi:MAG: tRNA dihydrouridine synthase DusB [Clostridia bacterium]|nr:tRNA dihydrouridine synthase DusB [Clostridia bacterium]
MTLNRIRLGKEETKNNIFLAPLAGYTNSVFRRMCYDLGAGLTFTEMVSAKGLCFGSEKTAELLEIDPAYEGINACQIFGSDPEFMKRAAESEHLSRFPVIDINMGCPVPKIYKNGEGSALLSDLPLASKIIKAVVSAGKIVTVKFRTGLSENYIVTADFAKMCEDSGASLVTVHGRTRDKMYAGPVNFDEIRKAKDAVSIPVIANGGVFTKDDAEYLLSETGADGVMVARGAMYDPWIFADITGTPYDKKTDILKQIEDTREAFGERFACVFMRKMVAFYTKGQRDSAKIRKELFTVKNTEELTKMVEDIV